MAKTRVKLKTDESQSIIGLRQLKSAFSLCLGFLVVAVRKDLESLLLPLRISCCKAVSQPPRNVGQEPSLLSACIKCHRKNTRLNLASVGFSVLELMTVITQQEESDMAFLVLQSKNLVRGF